MITLEEGETYRSLKNPKEPFIFVLAIVEYSQLSQIYYLEIDPETLESIRADMFEVTSLETEDWEIVDI